MFFMPDGMKGQLMQILDYQPKSMDVIHKTYEDTYNCYLAIPELCHELLQLCAMGYAGQIGGSYYVRKM